MNAIGISISKPDPAGDGVVGAAWARNRIKVGIKVQGNSQDWKIAYYAEAFQKRKSIMRDFLE